MQITWTAVLILLLSVFMCINSCRLKRETWSHNLIQCLDLIFFSLNIHSGCEILQFIAENILKHFKKYYIHNVKFL